MEFGKGALCRDCGRPRRGHHRYRPEETPEEVGARIARTALDQMRRTLRSEKEA